MEVTTPSSPGTSSPELAETTTQADPAVDNVVDNAGFMSAVFGELPGTQRPTVVGVKGRINAKTRWPAGDLVHVERIGAVVAEILAELSAALVEGAT